MNRKNSKGLFRFVKRFHWSATPLLTVGVLSQCLYDILINALLFADIHFDDDDHGPLLGEFEPNVVCNGHARLQSEV